MRIIVRIAVTLVYLILAIPAWAALGILTMPTVVKQIWRGPRKPQAPKANPDEKEIFMRAVAEHFAKAAPQTDTVAGKPTRADWNKVSYYDLRREGNC